METYLYLPFVNINRLSVIDEQWMIITNIINEIGHHFYFFLKYKPITMFSIQTKIAPAKYKAGYSKLYDVLLESLTGLTHIKVAITFAGLIIYQILFE